MISAWIHSNGLPTRRCRRSVVIFLGVLLVGIFALPAQELKLQRSEATVVVVPYGKNIVRVSLSLGSGDAMAGPGYGLIAKPSAAGWTVDRSPQGDVLRSDDVVFSVEALNAYIAANTTSAEEVKA